MIFVVNEGFDKWETVKPTGFISLKIWERKHIEEWIRSSPDILGEDLLIVSMEFDKFVQSDDRLDLLAIDRQGNLVVIELKRDILAGYADLQAIRYAAMISAMNLEKLLPYYSSYKNKYEGEMIDESMAFGEITEFVNVDDFEELSNKPRIILCSEGFSTEVTTTALWLRQFGVDISCITIKPYKVNQSVIIVPTKVIPIQEAKDYLVDIQKKEDIQLNLGKKKKPKTMKYLIQSGLLKPGQKIYLKNDLPNYLCYDSENLIYHATVTGKVGQSNSVLWDFDSKEYSISNLTWQIFWDNHPDKKVPGGVNGNVHWVTEEGINLWSLSFQKKNETSPNENSL